ncbi:MAG TPA: hypothetical protein VFJ82_15445 [Longimicrobium sp.]|nr:hypothetical protein [Longimicrobium sp.]
MAPHEEAPELMGMDPATGECFFARQPADGREVYRALRAVAVAELQCLRYGGTDEGILTRLARLGETEVCDHAPPADAGEAPRTHVSVHAPSAASAWEVAEALAERVGRTGYPAWRARPPVSDGPEVRLDFSWSETDGQSLWISADARAAGRWLVRHRPAERLTQVGVAMSLDDWLRDDPRFGDLRWYTEAEWDAGGHDGSPWPF